MDVLRFPLLGRFLRWRHARIAMQLPLLLLAAVVIYDGLRGPQVAPLNLAGVLPWIHWRGLVVLGLLSAGNVFCFACPFVLPRTLARRWLPNGRAWPRPLRNKWPAVGLLLLFLWAYEAFALWDSPWWTAWIALGYFAAAFLVDGLFRGGSFCKYVCPIGQFNFVQSLVSPLEVAVRDPAVCVSCQTKDCIRGRAGIPGCELRLFQPRKAGNMDCTFCLDCIHACPHDNLGITVRPPASDLWHDPPRSGVGHFSKRPDLAALVLVLVFGAFANAAGMVGPIVDWQERFGAQTGVPRLALVSAFYLFALILLPALAVAVAASASHTLGRLSAGRLNVATRYAYALIPLGFGMWLAHYSYHFFTSYDAVLPAAQRFVADRGWLTGGASDWVCNCCRALSDGLLRFEILALDVGLLLSLYTAYRISRSQSPRPLRTLRLGGTAVAPVRAGDLDCVPAHANARHHAVRGMNMPRHRDTPWQVFPRTQAPLGNARREAELPDKGVAAGPARDAKRSFADVRPQAELGYEGCCRNARWLVLAVAWFFPLRACQRGWRHPARLRAARRLPHHRVHLSDALANRTRGLQYPGAGRRHSPAADGSARYDPRPPRGQSGHVIRATATTEAATNKLFRAAQLMLNQSGWWQLEVSLPEEKEPIRIPFEVEVAAGLPTWMSLGLWISWPALAVLLFGVHRVLVGRRLQRL